MPDNLGIGNPEQFSYTPVYGLDCSIQCGGESDAIERIDEFFEAALGLGDDLSQLIELFVGGRGCPLLQAAYQDFQLCDAFSPSIYKADKRHSDAENRNGKQSQVIGKALQPFPRLCR